MNILPVLLLTAGLAFSQTLTLTNPTSIRHVTRNSHPRIEANFSLTFTAGSGITAPPVAALQFTVYSFVPGQLTNLTAIPGAGSVLAGKGISCGTLTGTTYIQTTPWTGIPGTPLPPGTFNCIIYGLNQTLFTTGDVADFTVIFLNNTGLKETRFGLSGVVGVDQTGNLIPVTVQ